MRQTIPAILAIMLLFPAAVPAQTLEPGKPGVTAAMKWLPLVDEGKYAESWSAAAAHFRGAITQARWQESVTGVRKPLGKVISRAVKTRTPQATLPGAPAGEYVIVTFDTSFEKRKATVETVTAVKEKDGVWRICGYYIQ